MKLGRRALGVLACGLAVPAAAQRRGEWARFRERFITPEGRVLDTGNGDISHSEGQGWAMLLAAAHDDRAAFQMLHGWTRGTLGRPSDALFSWRFRPGGTPPVDDPNNATDGDLYIAWALANAGRRWGNPALTAAAAAIGRDVLRLLTRRLRGRLLLLPGSLGFEDQQRLVVNPSYLVFPAFAVLDGVVPDPRWRQLAADGLDLLREARFGRWALPPDWLAIARADGRLSPATGWPPRFSYDAVRVPLLLAWAGHGAEPAAQSALRFWTGSTPGGPPAWADLQTNQVAEYRASGGVRAIAAMVAASGGGPRPAWPALEAADDYYSAALKMLVQLALS